LGREKRLNTLLSDGCDFDAAVLFSLIFAGGHLSNPGENKLGIFMVFIDGMNICFTLWRTGNLWFGIGNHAAWEWGQTFLFGTPDSAMHGKHALMNPTFRGPTLLTGSTDGPECSVLVLISEGLFVVLIALLYRSRRYPLITDRAVEEDDATFSLNRETS
jgi:membrane protease YdiL (CAAX protease family)